MSDYDIVIKLDPAQPVAGAKQVTAAVAQVEVVGQKAKEAVEGVASAAKSLKSIEFKQAAAAGAAAWGVLSAKLDIANTAIGQAIDASVKFGAIGAQIAGPWGAALGAIAGGVIELTDNITGLRSEVTKLADESKKLAEDAIAKMDGKLGELAREAKNTGDAWKTMNEHLYATPGALAATFDAFTKQRDVLKQAADQIERYNANAAAMRAVGIMNKATGQSGFFGSTLGGGVGAAANAGLFQTLPTGGGEQRYYNGVSPLDAYSGALAPKAYLGLGVGADGNPLEQFDLAKIAADDLNTKITANAEQTLKLAENTRKWNDELVQTNITAQVVSEVLTKAASSFADTLVDAANGADVSWRKWGADMLVMIEKIIAQALVLKAIGSTTGGIGGGGTGLLGLLFGGAHATGGSYTAPSTGGGPDSIPVLFRMSPNETATFTPQGQAFGGTAGGGPAGGTTYLTIQPQIHDERAIQAAMAGPGGQRVIYNVVRQATGAVRPLG